MVDIQHIECKKINRKRLQIAKISFRIRKLSQGIECRCHYFNRKLINSSFCACAVEIWLKIALNAAKLPKLEGTNRKSWSPRTIVVIYFCFRSRLTWFCACADSYVVFNTGTYTILGDNSIYHSRTAMQVVQWIGKSGSSISNTWEKKTAPTHRSRDTACAVSENAFLVVFYGKY